MTWRRIVFSLLICVSSALGNDETREREHAQRRSAASTYYGRPNLRPSRPPSVPLDGGTSGEVSYDINGRPLDSFYARLKTDVNIAFNRSSGIR